MKHDWLRATGRTGLVFVLLLAKCSSGTGPSLDDPMQLTARINGAVWAPVDSARTFAFWRSDSVFFVGGIRNDSAGVALDGLGVQVTRFTGPGAYSLADDPFNSNGEYVVYDQATPYATLSPASSAFKRRRWAAAPAWRSRTGHSA
jgi:hypothetical protein